MLNIIICGDRRWTDRGWMRMVMSALKANLGPYTVLEGEARGADTLAREIAVDDLELPFVAFVAWWKAFGKGAEGKADAVVAFHPDLWHSSRGTLDMVKRAAARGLPVWVSSDGPEAFARFIVRLRGQGVPSSLPTGDNSGTRKA